MSLAFELSLAEGIVGWAFMLSKVAVGSEHWSARDCVSLTGSACKGLCVPGRGGGGGSTGQRKGLDQLFGQRKVLDLVEGALVSIRSLTSCMVSVGSLTKKA